MTTLERLLSRQTREGSLWEILDERRIRCHACGHECPIFEGQAGVCKVRRNQGGRLMVPWGYVSGAHCDPVEKKPFYHVAPGSLAYSFGMLGCDLHCSYCQNWITSQTVRDPEAVATAIRATPEGLVRQALAEGAVLMVSTYNEPLITVEWAGEVFDGAKKKGLRTAFVSNGYATPEAAAFLKPRLDFWKADLKSFDDGKYRKVCGAELSKVLDGIRTIKDSGFWLEIVTLLIPGFNDSDAEIGAMAGFVAGLSPDIPWHLTAFHPDHLMTDVPPTPAGTLLRARDIAAAKGLRYVYCGNIPGVNGQDTVCPSCGLTLVEREGFSVRKDLLGGKGTCGCGFKVPGVWA